MALVVHFDLDVRYGEVLEFCLRARVYHCKNESDIGSMLSLSGQSIVIWHLDCALHSDLMLSCVLS